MLCYPTRQQRSGAGGRTLWHVWGYNCSSTTHQCRWLERNSAVNVRAGMPRYCNELRRRVVRAGSLHAWRSLREPSARRGRIVVYVISEIFFKDKSAFLRCLVSWNTAVYSDGVPRVCSARNFITFIGGSTGEAVSEVASTSSDIRELSMNKTVVVDDLPEVAHSSDGSRNV